MIPAKACAVALVLVAGLGCTETETKEQIVHVYDPYEGAPAYPDRRPKLDVAGVTAAWVSNNASDTISVLDLDHAKVVGDAPVGRNPVDLDGPHHLAVDRAAGFVYVALSYPAPAAIPGPHAAHASSTRSGYVQKLAIDDLRPLGEVRVDPNPGDIVLSADGKRLVVSHFDLKKALEADAGVEDKRASIARIDPASLLESGSPDPIRITTCVAPHGVALSGDGKTAWVACYGEDAIAVVDLDDPSAEPERIPVGPGAGPAGQPAYGPYSAVPSADGALLAVGDTESKDVRFFDTAAKAMTPNVAKLLGAPYFAAWSADGTKIWVPIQSPDALVVLDPATGAELATKPLGKAAGCVKPHEAVLGPGGAAVYVACEGDHVAPSVVVALDPQTLDVVASFPVGAYPDRVAIAEAP